MDETNTFTRPNPLNMKTLIIFPMLLLSAATYAQDHQTAPNKGDQQGNSNTSQSPVKQLVVPVDTQVFVIDLGNPSAGGNKSTGQSKPLQFLSRRPVQLQLIKGNPYKYKYVVNSRFVNFFENDGQSFVEEYKKSLDTPPVPEPKAAEVQAAATDAKKTATVLHVQLTKPKTKAIEKKALSDSKNFIAGFAKSPVLSSGSFDKSDQEVISKAARSEASKKEILDAVEVVRSVYVAKAVNSQKILGDKSKIPENGADDLENFNAAVNQTKIDADKFSREVETFAKAIGKQESLADDFDKTRKSFLDRAEEFTKNYLALKYDQARLASTSTEAGGNLDSVRDTLKDTMEKIAKFFDLKMDNYTLPIDVNGKNIDALEFTVQRFENDNSPTAIDSYCYTMWVNRQRSFPVRRGHDDQYFAPQRFLDKPDIEFRRVGHHQTAVSIACRTGRHTRETGAGYSERRMRDGKRQKDFGPLRGRRQDHLRFGEQYRSSHKR
jgi:hypothetical protein